MKIKKKGNQFIAYCDENDNFVGVELRSPIKVGNWLGQISIKTGRFVGNTICASLLHKHLDDYEKLNGAYKSKKDQLIDGCIERIKKDIAEQDLTAIDELLRFVPEKYLKGFLSEN
jgi:hypothetical protein